MNRLRQLLEPLIACVQSAVTRKWDSIKFRDEMRRAVEQSCGGVKDWDAFGTTSQLRERRCDVRAA